jgi:DNA-binding XRE family transcriptional regulator
MSEHTKKHPIKAQSHSATLYITHRHTTYAIPKNIAEKYILDEDKPRKKVRNSVPAKAFFQALDKKFTKAGALLRGLRVREGLSQVQFAKKINVTQANLSNMENGHRPIGKIIAKRIERVFGTDYRYFL